VPQFRIVEIADVLGVSDDTVRRWIDTGDLTAVSDARGRRVVDGVSAARLAQERARPLPDPVAVGRAARNRFVGLVTGVDHGAVVCRVEMLCGNSPIEAVVSTEAVTELGLEPGTLAVATVKDTQVIIERPPA
jgi:molybdopterin-binding protein